MGQRTGVRKMRRLMAAILIVAVLLLCSCSKSGAGKSQDSESHTSSDTISTVTDASSAQGKKTDEAESKEDFDEPRQIEFGSEIIRGFTFDNVLHSDYDGDIHFGLYIPESYDGTKPYALFITLPGWEGLYFQGVGANMVEDFGVEAIGYNAEMIVVSTQLSDWKETSAKQAIALTEYFLNHYNIDPGKVYLHGYSGGGETGSLVMGMKPELYTAFLCTSSKWDGDLSILAAAKTPVYIATGAEDSYYGSSSLKKAYAELCDYYRNAGVSEDEINRLAVLDIKEQDYFVKAGFSDQHAGGQAFAHDENVMSWLFGEH